MLSVSVSRDMLEVEVGDRLCSIFEVTKWHLGPSTCALGEGSVGGYKAKGISQSMTLAVAPCECVLAVARTEEPTVERGVGTVVLRASIEKLADALGDI